MEWVIFSFYQVLDFSCAFPSIFLLTICFRCFVSVHIKHSCEGKEDAGVKGQLAKPPAYPPRVQCGCFFVLHTTFHLTT